MRLLLKTLWTDLAGERNKVMLTHGEHFDISNDDHLVVILVEHGVVQHV